METKTKILIGILILDIGAILAGERLEKKGCGYTDLLHEDRNFELFC